MTRLKFGGEKRLKSGNEKRSRPGKENWLKSGKEKRSKLGKELAVAAPMTARAAKDNAIAGTRFEATCCAPSGRLSPLRFLIPCFGHLRSLRLSPVAKFFPVAGHQEKPSQCRSSNNSRASRGRIRLKSWACMVNARLCQRPARTSRPHVRCFPRKRAFTDTPAMPRASMLSFSSSRTGLGLSSVTARPPFRGTTVLHLTARAAVLCGIFKVIGQPDRTGERVAAPPKTPFRRPA